MAAAAKSKFYVDTAKLEELMKEALEQERDYRLRNDAKFRATEQKAATYEAFKCELARTFFIFKNG
jgi:Dynein attachment factor N-terminus